MNPIAPLPLAAWPLVFLAWPFLFAALAAAIPVVLHLINRQTAKQAPFPTLRFLRISVQKTRRRKRIHDLLLLLLRAGALVLVALGLAKPTVTNLNLLLGGSQSAVVVVLDNSASMGMIDPEAARLDTAVGAAKQVLDELADGDEVALLPTCGPLSRAEPRLERAQEKVRRDLDLCRVSYERADLPLRLRQAQRLLADSEAPNKQIYVITDMQKASWGGLKTGGEGTDGISLPAPEKTESAAAPPHPNPLPKGEGTDAKIPIIIVDCNRAPKPNVALHGVTVDAALPAAGMPVRITVELKNTCEAPQPRLVELVIDGTKEQTSPVLAVPPLGRVKHEFQFAFPRGGLHRGEVRLVGEDGSKYDDARFFTIEIDQAIPVAVVKDRRQEIPYLEDAYYLERAFSRGRAGGQAIQRTALVAEDLRSEPLEKYRVIFCVNLPSLDREAAERLRAYVAGGGNLVWIAGDNVIPENYNQMNQEARGQLLPAPLAEVRAAKGQQDRDAWHVDSLDAKHPALALLVDPPKLYQSVLVYKYVRMEIEKSPDAAVLARLDDGQPLLVERNVEQGRVLMLGTGAHVGWTNLPLRPIFLPLVTRLVFDLAGMDQTRYEAVAGTALALPLENEPRAVSVEILRPTGETLRRTSEAEKGRRGQVFRYDGTSDVGIYTLRLLDAVQPRRVAFAVNGDPAEDDPTAIDREDLRQRLAPAAVAFAEDPDDLSSTFTMLREGRSLWAPLLWAVLAVLVFETFLSNRLSPAADPRATAVSAVQS